MKSFKSRINRKMKRRLNYKNKVLSILLISVIIFGMIPMQAYSTVDASNSDNIEIKDENLEKLLKEEIKEINPDYNSKNIFKEDMELLTEIDLSNKGIKSLEGIENAVNLKNINLEGNEIADISPLGEIVNLENANISNQKIEIKEVKSIDEELTISNPLIGLDKETISNIQGESLDVVDKSIRLNDISESKLVEINFEENYENKIFSGKIILDLSIEKEENIEDEIVENFENTENVEDEILDEDINKTDKSTTLPTPETSNDLNKDFHSSGKSSKYGGDKEAKKDLDVVEVGKSNIKIGSEKIADDPNRVQQTGMVTSNYQLDFTWSFKIKGKIKMKSSPDGVAITFHDNKDLEVDKTGSYMGIYGRQDTGLKKGIVLEVDSEANNNRDVGDYGVNCKHMAISAIDERDNNGNANVFSRERLEEADFNSIDGIDFEVVWNRYSSTLHLKYNGKSIKHKFSDEDLLYQFGDDKRAYMSVSGAVNFGSGNGGNVIDISLESVEYTDIGITEVKFYVYGRYINSAPINSECNAYNNGCSTYGYLYWDCMSDTLKYYDHRKEIHNSEVGKIEDSGGFSFEIYDENNNKVNSVTTSNIHSNIKDEINQKNIKFKVGYSIKFNTRQDFGTHWWQNLDKAINPIGDVWYRSQEYERHKNGYLFNKRFLLVEESNGHLHWQEYLEQDSYVSFNDNNLYKKIHKTLELNYYLGTVILPSTVPPNSIFKFDLDRLTHLSFADVDEKPIDLTNLRYAKNLESLKLDGSINLNLDIAKTEIEEIKKLSDLSYRKIGLTNIEKLPDISTIKTLDLGENNLTNIGEFGEFYSNLRSLIIDNNKISDLMFLNRLLNLEVLNLKNNEISNINQVGNLNNLSEFYLDNNKISDLRPIKNQIEMVKIKGNKYSIKNQNVDIDRLYINSGDFELENVVYNANNIESNINTISNEGEYDLNSDKIVWKNIHEGEHALDYNWFNNDFRFSGKVNIKLNQVPGPDYLVTIPASLDMGDVLDENSSDYDPEIDKTSIKYKPDKEVTKKNPIVSGMVGAKDIISIVSDDNIIGNVNIYTDSVFTMKNVEDSKDSTLVDVYKTFENKLNGTASSKEDILMSLNNTNRKGVFRIKSPTSRFKDNNAEYKGIMNFVIEHVK